MGRVYDEGINEQLAGFIARQHVFFVATAPLAADGHVNLSPKGLDTFRVLGPTTVAYLDLTGSGVETIAHLRENGRLTVMFCAFEGPPRILRLAGDRRGRPARPRRWRRRSRAARRPGGRPVAVDRVRTRAGTACPATPTRASARG